MTSEKFKPRNDNLLGCVPGDIGRYVFLPGDPGRVPKIAEYLNEPAQVTRNRAFNVFSGSLLGEKVTVVSTGIGGPSTAIAVEELVSLGAEVLIRVGTSGLMQRFMQTGDLVIAWGAIRNEHTSQQILPLEYPAVADLDVTLALNAAADQLDLRKFTGVIQSKDSFYAEHEPKRMPVKQQLLENWETWQQAGALCSEMEAAILFVLARKLGVRAGGIMVVGISSQDLDNLIRTAIRGAEILIQQEREVV